MALVTEDGAPLPPEAAAAGLSLRVTPPGGGRAEAVAYTLGGVEEGAGAAVTEDGHYAFQLADLMQVGGPMAADELQGLCCPHVADGSVTYPTIHHVSITTCQAGSYRAVVEYTESRTELLAGMSKKEAVLRSSSLQFVVLPGPPVTLGLSTGGSSALPERVAVTNGPNARQRTLLRAVGAQLQDAHGNAAPTAGVQLRFAIRAPEGGGRAGGAALPRLQTVEGLASWETDGEGKAYVGDLAIEQGSGGSWRRGGAMAAR